MSNTVGTMNRARVAGGLAVIAVLGWLCIVVPVMGTSPLMPAPLFPLVRTGVEKLSWVPIALLCGVGLVAGFATRLPRVGIALASIAVLPVVMVAEMLADSTSHNLFPLEMVMYLFIAAPVLLMAFIGRAVRGATIGRRVAASRGAGV